MKDQYINNTLEATHFIQSIISDKKFVPRVAITLGSGLGKLAELIVPVASIPYDTIPNFPVSTVAGHDGILIAGFLEGVPIIGFKGRKHYYEVARQPDAMDIVTFPVHVAANLGCRRYIATNAAGGLNPEYVVGDLMAITSHIGLFQPNPLAGAFHDFGNTDYFLPQNMEYSFALRKLFRSTDQSIREGVYVGLPGRTFETSAECQILRQLGADAVGMSTVPEIIAATSRGMETFGVSMITNVIAKDGTNATNHEEVMAILNSKKIEKKLYRVFKKFFGGIGQQKRTNDGR